MKIALLIDADNAPLSQLDAVMEMLTQRGELSIRRAYGNWSKPHLSAWPPYLNKHAIKAEQQFDYAICKNATDMALTVAAMDLLYTSECDTFALVSSDCDFTPLAIRLREAGRQVIGFGRPQTPEAFRNSCTEFIIHETRTADSTENPTSEATATVPPKPSRKAPCPSKSEVHEQLRELSAKKSGQNGYFTSEEANDRLRRYALEQNKNFTLARLGGYRSWRQFFNQYSGLYEAGNSRNTYRVIPSNTKSEPSAPIPARPAEEAEPDTCHPTPLPQPPLARIHLWLRRIADASKGEEAYTTITHAGAQLHKLARSEGWQFDIRHYGHSRLTDFLNNYPNLYEVSRRQGSNVTIYRNRQAQAQQT